MALFISVAVLSGCSASENITSAGTSIVTETTIVAEETTTVATESGATKAEALTDITTIITEQTTQTETVISESMTSTEANTTEKQTITSEKAPEENTTSPIETIEKQEETIMTTELSNNKSEEEFTETTEGFVHAEGNKIIGINGEPVIIKGIALGNSVWSNPSSPNTNHHTEETYKELSEMGFNCVRFYINYALFEKDSKPYSYDQAGFDWIDTNIEWAKKHNMGIILNMHYPQGGYQSTGNGTQLWTDVENQKRLTALWKAIAEKYSEENTILGYGLINEPVLPFYGSYDEAAEQYFRFVEGLTKEIRSVSPNQAVFVEKICNLKSMNDSEIDWEWFTVENTFPIINDNNVIYEFHCYDPMSFTHQDTSWTGYAGLYQLYPANEITSADYESYWVDCERAKEESTDGEWQFFVSKPRELTKNYNVVAAALNGKQSENGAVYFDDIELVEISEDGKETVIATYAFDNGTAGSFNPWSSDGTGEQTWSPEGRKGGCLKISGAKADFTTTGPKFEMKENCKYRVSGYMRKENVENQPAIRMDFAKADNIRTNNKEYLESVLKSYADFGKNNNVPLYLGEFGVASSGFKENRGGTNWVSDMIDLCYKYCIGFNYHTYHEESFGLYSSSDTKLPDEKDLNRELAELFRKKLK